MGDFTWYNGDAAVYCKGDVPETGRAYVITIGGASRSQAGDFLDGNADAYGFEVPGV